MREPNLWSIRMLLASRFAGFEYPVENWAVYWDSGPPFGKGNESRIGRIPDGAPCLVASEGTSDTTNVGLRRRRPSYEKKKNVRSRISGPPSTPPKSFNRKPGLACPLLFANQSVASSAPFRKYSWRLPWN